MNRLSVVLFFGLLYVLNVTALAGALSPAEIIPAFYRLLTQDTKPTPAEEQSFFGGKECLAFKSVLLSDSAGNPSQTPIWDYLRSHREMFMTENVHNFKDIKATISPPFKMSVFIKNKQISEDRVLVQFPEKKIGEHAYTGNSTIVFILGKNCYVDVEGVLISRTNVHLLEKLYAERGR